MYELHGIVALELRKRSRVTINADVAQRRRFALHDRTPAEVRFNIGNGMIRLGFAASF